MRTRYFQEGATECPLVAITEYDPSEVSALAIDISRMRAGAAERVVIEGDVRLHLEQSNRDVGISAVSGIELVCALRAQTWENIEGLLEPFAEWNQSGYQWLDVTGDVKLLLSRTGEW